MAVPLARQNPEKTDSSDMMTNWCSPQLALLRWSLYSKKTRFTTKVVALDIGSIRHLFCTFTKLKDSLGGS